MPATWLSTVLDQEQIELYTPIAGRLDAVEGMPDRAGGDIAVELGARHLVRFLTDSQIPQFVGGSPDRPHWVTPTPVPPEHVVEWLAVFAPKVPRTHVLLLDPAKIDVVRGPAWVRLGMGIEYYLPDGFPAEAVVDVGVMQVK